MNKLFYSISSSDTSLSTVEVDTAAIDFTAAFSSVTDVTLLESTVTLFHLYERTLYGIIQGDMLSHISTGLSAAWSLSGTFNLISYKYMISFQKVQYLLKYSIKHLR